MVKGVPENMKLFDFVNLQCVLIIGDLLKFDAYIFEIFSIVNRDRATVSVEILVNVGCGAAPIGVSICRTWSMVPGG